MGEPAQPYSPASLHRPSSAWYQAVGHHLVKLEWGSGAEVSPVLQGQERGVLRGKGCPGQLWCEYCVCRQSRLLHRQRRQLPTETGGRWPKKAPPSNLTSCLAFPPLDAFLWVNRRLLVKRNYQGEGEPINPLSVTEPSISYLCQLISESVGLEEEISREDALMSICKQDSPDGKALKIDTPSRAWTYIYYCSSRPLQNSLLVFTKKSRRKQSPLS